MHSPEPKSGTKEFGKGGVEGFGKLPPGCPETKHLEDRGACQLLETQAGDRVIGILPGATFEAESADSHRPSLNPNMLEKFIWAFLKPQVTCLCYFRFLKKSNPLRGQLFVFIPLFQRASH